MSDLSRMSSESQAIGRVASWMEWLGSLAKEGMHWLEVAVDHLNPILVKETRQALKSRQFILTFLIVLVACWVASFAVVAIIGPEVYYGAEGATMLWVYSAILAFPLVMIVPYSAFRSIAVEQEDNTYELLSITTLSARRIIMGKLGSAIVQMLVYLSAVSPCIGFTFLLRGVDALTVVVLLGTTILASLGLSMLALLVGTAARVRYTQVLLSVLLVLVFALVFFATIPMSFGFIQQSDQFLRDLWFWIGVLAFLTLYGTTFALLHEAAAAQIAFSSENRSTMLRWLMLIQYACFLGWMSLPLTTDGMDTIAPVVFVSAIVSAIYWFLMGALLTSEWPHLSRRVERSLPQSRLGRSFLTWLNPGPGTGYMFCVANLTFLLTAGIAFLVGVAASRGWSQRWWSLEGMIYFLILSWAYLVAFLGIGRLAIGFLRRWVYVSFTAGFLFHIIFLLVACGGPLLVEYLATGLRVSNSYSLWHLSNPIWTLTTLADYGVSAFDVLAATLVVAATAIIVFILNMRAVAYDMRLQRRALPERIVEEEAELYPLPEPKPTSPWDEPDR